MKSAYRIPDTPNNSVALRHRAKATIPDQPLHRALVHHHVIEAAPN